jgi:hypothetical protein
LGSEALSTHFATDSVLALSLLQTLSVDLGVL